MTMCAAVDPPVGMWRGGGEGQWRVGVETVGMVSADTDNKDGQGQGQQWRMLLETNDTEDKLNDDGNKLRR